METLGKSLQKSNHFLTRNISQLFFHQDSNFFMTFVARNLAENLSK